MVSGHDTDKSDVFETFYGELETAPMIADCPVNMECRLYQLVDFKTHDLFIGEIISTHADESVLTDGNVDMDKLKPMLFDMARKEYFKLGESFAKCWGVGMNYKKQL
jgi:flavin reductase (DIM6/NTAB) family NADH-FMN oxidoreductase RutF